MNRVYLKTVKRNREISIRFLLVVLMIFSIYSVKSRAEESLKIIDHFTVKMMELSGLTSKKISPNEFVVYSVGDYENKINKIKIINKDIMMDSINIDMNPALVKDIQKKSILGQWEALGFYNNDICVLNEKNEDITCFDEQIKNMTQKIVIISENNLNKSNRYEGMCFTNDKLFISQKKNHPEIHIYRINKNLNNGKVNAQLDGIIQFNSNSDIHKCSIEDMSFYDESLYLLSDKCKKIFKIKNFNKNTITKIESFVLPKQIQNPEGLSVLSSYMFIIASDLKKIKPNLFLLEMINE